jgi:polysaccharide deacetylase family protein (PEP-CTERM system associated)
MTSPARHILTVNLEDYFQVGAFSQHIQQNRWRRFESRVEITTDRTLDLLAKHQATATFFVLGWIAEQYPHVVKKVADAGHEVAVRGYFHQAPKDMTAEVFRADVVRARNAVEAATGREVYGHRIADGWLAQNQLWVLDVLADLGFAYDSSIASIGGGFHHDPQRLTPHEHRNEERGILELPISTGNVFGVRMPVASGNFLRQFPLWLTRRAVNKWVNAHSTPLLTYFHTWELDPEQPQLTGVGWLKRMRHYRNLKSMPDRIATLLQMFQFGSAAQYLGITVEPAPPRTGFTHETPNTVESISSRYTSEETPRQPVSIVVPCYNEEPIVSHLKNTLGEVQQKLGTQYQLEFVLVDDGSTDQTWKKLQEAFQNRTDVHLLRHDVNQGVSAAIMTGIRGAHNDVVCSMDSDCSYDPLKLGDLIPMLVTGVDLVTASPYHPEGAVKNVPAWRLTLSKGCAWLYGRILKTKLHTYTSCLRVYRRSTVAAIPLLHGRYLGIAELIGRLDLAGKTVIEHPAVLECRILGRSKMKTTRTIFGHLGLMIRLVWDRFRQEHSSDRDQVIRGQLDFLQQTVVADLNSAPVVPPKHDVGVQTPLRPVPAPSTRVDLTPQSAPYMTQK